MSNLELGQLLTTDRDWHRYDADWATDGLYMIAQIIAEDRGKDPLGGWVTLTSNSGEEEYINDIFEMRPYCWCDGEHEGHQDGCPPNFIYKPTGLSIQWYKHAGRGIVANQKYNSAIYWFNIVKSCIDSI